MKPEMPSPSLNHEQISVKNENFVDRKVEADTSRVAESQGERYEQKSENNALISDVSTTTLLPTPVVDSNNVGIITTIGATPLVANDDDLIEKEWVDKAKKIIAGTYNNPHQREKAVSELQVVYLKKRYGKELGAAE